MKVHFIGIGGAGTSAAAAIAKKKGFEVSGCDIDSSSSYLPELKKLGIDIKIDHHPSHVNENDLIVNSYAIEKVNSENSEILEAKKRDLGVLTTEEFVAQHLARNKKIIAITGTHGKSTTSAMVAMVLEDAGLDPTAYIGAIVLKWGRNYRFGKGEYFVIEADEYREKFLNYNPKIGIITNVEFDHPDFYKDEESMVQSFAKFVKGFEKDSKLIVGDKNNENIKKIIGASQDIEFLESTKDHEPKINLQIPGIHNVENAKLAFLCGEALGIDEETILKTLNNFTGISRRFEFKGDVSDVKVFDDYAHHPTEISASLLAFREKFPNERIWCVYQPHMYTRTKALFTKFVRSFEESTVDKLIIVDIFAAREENTENISSLDLVKSIKNKDAKYIGDLEQTAVYVAKNISAGDVVVAMGAGDINKLSGLILNKLRGQNGR